ncbi:amidohydrolase [Halobacterium sp. CBA1126]|uniref:amidohydrolase n=1 Tax=Halobacterium TaxID=2239 RepID=UPI0012F7436F|nr:amidohydrolase [Halobacterium sp. CBA1126]MUV59319.1 amidohydrolase [Halobacterium sp. CBA1126]
MSRTHHSSLSDRRRRFHRYPEPAWCEFWTTCRLVDEIEQIGVDALHVGPDAIDTTQRMNVPDEDTLTAWYERARDAGARQSVLEQLEGGNTGAVAVLERGDGPTIGLRVDIDALHIEESDSADHVPAADGFRSETGDTMHACGHDAHMTIGLGVLEAVKESEFSGTLKVFFQPAEEAGGGGKPMAETDHLADVDYLYAVHVGLGHPTGEVVAGIVKPLAMAHITATFSGTPAHAGNAPQAGDNTIQAASSAVSDLYGIPRHADGLTRVNVGRIEGGSVSNVVADETTLWGEVRGETTELMRYMQDAFTQRVEAAAAAHGCTVDVDVVSECPRADSDPELAAVVADTARGRHDVQTVLDSAEFGASEDATFLMQRVQEQGGRACYAIVGTDHPGDHHTPTFDVDERTLETGVDVLTDAIVATAAQRP